MRTSTRRMASRIQIGFAFACVNSLILAQAPPSAGNTQSQGVTASVAPAPPLSDPTRPASVTVSAFLDWISRSVPSQGEAARVMIRQAQFDARVAVALGEEALAARTKDHSRTLMALSVLGELRHPEGEPYLRKFLHLPLPETGTVIEGDIAERKALEMLQAKAIHGLAYAGTPSADAEVLAAAAKHPSANVRAEAVRAYLFNHQQDSGAARAALLRVLQPQDRKLLDVPEHNPTVTGIEFDRQLARYLQMYPDAQAPPPTRAPNKSEPQSVR